MFLKITEDLVKVIMCWRHSGFNVFCGARINPGDEGAIENLARYISRASFCQERMSYIPEESKVIYQSKDGKEQRVFDALEWLAAMSSHIPEKGESRRAGVHYYGYYPAWRDLPLQMQKARPRRLNTLHPETRRILEGLSNSLVSMGIRSFQEEPNLDFQMRSASSERSHF